MVSGASHDEELVLAAIAGDGEAYALLIQRYFGLVYAVALAGVGQRETAEDLTQETFVRAFLNLAGLKNIAALPAWLTRIARNMALDWHRKNQRRSAFLALIEVDDTHLQIPDERIVPADRRMEMDETQSEIREALARLPVEQREVLLLHFMEGIGQREIAGMLGTSQARVSRIFKRALGAMRTRLEERMRREMEMMRSAPQAQRRALGLVGAVAALPLAAKASMAAASAPVLSALAASAAAQAGGGLAGWAHAIKMFYTTGGKVMIAIKTLATAAAVMSVVMTAAVRISASGAKETTANQARAYDSAVATPSQTETPAPGARILHFPKDHAVGMVMLLDPDPSHEMESYFYAVASGEGKSFALARGDVAVPPGKRIKLMLNTDGGRDLSWLAKLKPNDIDVLHWGRCLVDPTDQAIDQITVLAGLKELSLAGGMIRTGGKNPCPITINGFKKLRDMRSLECLTLPFHMTDEQFAALGGMQTLKALGIQSNNFTDRGLAPLATMTHLEQLSMGGERMTDAGLVYIEKLPLTHLRLWGHNFTDAALPHLKKVKSLTSLNLLHHKITSAGLADIAEMQNLEQLALGHTQVSDEGLAHLQSLKKLKALGLGWTRVTNEGVPQLRGMQSLETLDLNCQAITGQCYPYLAALTNLKRLDLSSFGNCLVTDADVRPLTALTKLEKLNISGTEITDAGMADIAKLTSLKVLTLGTAAPKVTNRGLAELTGLHNLERLDLGNIGITISGLNALNSLTNLKVLNAGYCFKWKIAGEPPLDISGLKNLEQLWLASARDEDLACLVGLTKLNDLSITFADYAPGNTLSDEGMKYLAGLTSMGRLTIGGPGLTDAGLDQLAGMNKLWSLSLRGNFTDAGLHKLEGGHPWVDNINIYSGKNLSPQAVRRLRVGLPMATIFNVVGDRVLPKGGGSTTRPTSSPRPSPASSTNRHPKPGAPAPAFTAKTLDGNMFTLSAQRGKVVLLYFWATWCSPCMKSAPANKALQDQLRERFGDRFVWVDLSLDDQDVNVAEHVKKLGIQAVQIRIGQHSRVADAYGVGGVPDAFLIGSDGKILLNRESPQVDTETAIARALGMETGSKLSTGTSVETTVFNR